jgi:hypothetical protein
MADLHYHHQRLRHSLDEATVQGFRPACVVHCFAPATTATTPRARSQCHD